MHRVNVLAQRRRGLDRAHHPPSQLDLGQWQPEQRRGCHGGAEQVSIFEVVDPVGAEGFGDRWPRLPAAVSIARQDLHLGDALSFWTYAEDRCPAAEVL